MSDPRPKYFYRIPAVLGSMLLGIGGVLLGVSVAGALFGLPGLSGGPGGFFVDSYGILAFLIPAYLIVASLLLADPVYRPDRIF
ncbi:MAG: DNA translocase FtsK, partial [Treponema sp.]|nr:DNA translocase FtsK [Treponema sp.]